MRTYKKGIHSDHADHADQYQRALLIPRGGEIRSSTDIGGMVVEGTNNLKSYMSGSKSDTLILLLATALNTPICQKLSMSPILGFLLTGLFFGPNGFNLIKDVHATEHLADFGIVFFLFEMGIHLSFSTLWEMKRDVFGLGCTQFFLTAAAVALAARVSGLASGAQVVLAGALALSSSAFVLQLLKDKKQMDTEYGKKSFAVLLLQDLMVVPLLVIIPLLGGSGDVSTAAAVTSAVVCTIMAVSAIALFGKFLLNPLFDNVASANHQESFLGVTLLTILSMSFLTEGLGLSNTLGAFLAGVLLADTSHRHNIEVEMNPVRGILVGLFFFTVGFEIDLNLISSKTVQVLSIVLGIATVKTILATSACLMFGVDKGTAARCGLVLSQGGEFAFVAFRMARSFGVLSDDVTKMMLTCVSLTMAITPFLEEFGTNLAIKIEEKEQKKSE
eukprot:CAMPEP_0185732818 /NCGR_PEP_ID=MMETSP1171-20130828/17612_1 /TAXON_ID=374046 /ORGANISM="Helicotheca tamensis, Strain CCMP826" /LENGTH=444 /DNA_ID=CAMNT_0028402401 /DNA_START=158 /DNA_END=1492 /DNA_ORIENTATION=+